ncbi:hypothetical protein ACSBR1_013874 [Camellia fascicularis]
MAMSLEECEILLGKRKDSEISQTEWRDSITRQVYLLLQPYRKKEEDSHLIDLSFRKGRPKDYYCDREREAYEAFPSSAMEGGDSNWLFMIAKAVAALTLQAMSYVGFCTLEKLLPESAYNIVRESYFNVVVRFVLSVFDMEDFERIYELSIVKDECSTYYSNLCHAHCDPCVAVAEGKVKVEKFSTLREHDICDIIQQCQGCAENKGFEVYPWAFPFDPDKWNDISQSDIISAMREVLKYVPLKEDCKMQLTLELSRLKCYHILDNLTLEAVKDVKIQELHRFVDDVSSDESKAEDAKAMLYDFANGIIDGLYVLSDFKGDAIFPKHISFGASLFLSLRFANEIESGRVELQSYSDKWETESKKSPTSKKSQSYSVEVQLQFLQVLTNYKMKMKMKLKLKLKLMNGQ